MQMIKGITVKLILNAQDIGLNSSDGILSGLDGVPTSDANRNPFGELIDPEEITVEVDNVLVAPTTSDDIISTTDLEGCKAVYTLAIPKGDNHNWENAIVEFWGQRWKVFGIPLEGIEANIPLAWNKKVTVERYGK